MADKTIGQLVAATNVTPTDLFVLEQSGTAKKLTGQILENWLVSFADGHGGIQSITKTGTSGLVDTYTITLADTTTVTFTVTNGKAISSVTTYYAVSSDGSTAPSSWSTTRQSMTATNRYLWSYQHIAFNDNSSIDTVKTVIGVWGDKGDTGATGRGIVSLSQTSREPGQYTLYTFTMSDGTTETFYSYDGVGITGIAKTSSVGLVDLYTITYSNGTSTDFTVTNAKSITSVTLTGSSGLTDTYTVAFNDGTSTTFTVTNGSSILGITKTSTQGLVDTYTVSLTDGTSTTFTVTNAKSITRIEQTGGTHAAGTTDTYTIYFNDGDTAVFTVYNGTNGTGSVSAVDGIQPGGNQNVTLLTTGNGAPTTTTPGQLYQRYFDLSTQILYICIGVDTTTTPNTYSWAGTGVPVDASLSSSSENPVQNKVITAKVGTTALTTTATDLSGAVNELNAGKYEKPSAGIPKADLASSVQTSLGKADTALQSVPSTYRTAAAQDVIDAAQDANIGIVQNTNTATQNITKGQYVIWHGALYTASAAIASGATLSSSNLTVVTGGGLNDLNKSLKTAAVINSGLLTYAAGLANGEVRNYVLGSYVDTDVPNGYLTGVAEAHKRYNASGFVILYGQDSYPLINRYDNNTWKGWEYFYPEWRCILEDSSVANAAYDETISVTYPFAYSEILFTIERVSNGRTFASAVCTKNQFINAGLYAGGEYSLINTTLKNSEATHVNAVAIYVDASHIEIASLAGAEALKFRIWVR